MASLFYVTARSKSAIYFIDIFLLLGYNTCNVLSLYGGIV